MPKLSNIQFDKSLAFRNSEPIEYVDALKDIIFNIYESDRVGIMEPAEQKNIFIKVLARFTFHHLDKLKCQKIHLVYLILKWD